MPELSKPLASGRERLLDKGARFIVSSMQAVRESMVWLIPCLILSSFALLLASMGEWLLDERPGWVDVMYNTNQVIGEFFPYLMTATLSYVLAMHWRLPRPPVALINIFYLVLAAAMSHSDVALMTFHIVLSIVIPLFSVPLLAKLLAFERFNITSSNSAGSIVKESLNMVIPAIMVAAVVMLVTRGLFLLLSHLPFESLFSPDYANEPWLFGLTFSALNSLLWFVGVHGYYALLPMVDLLQEASSLSYSTVLAGGAVPYVMNLSFMGTFVFIGGSGATLSLVLALLLFARQRTLRLIALASIPIAFINVNEILLFGLPIIYNPRLLLPFVLTPMLNVVTGLLAVQWGWVSAPSVSVPFHTPVLFNAWVSTEGDWHAVLLQLFNVLLGCAIYFPAVKRMNKFYSGSEIKISALNTSYLRREEEAQWLQDDPILLAQQKQREQHTVEQHLRGISSKEFCLQYQPQVDLRTGRVTGCEALIRTMDEKGALQYPGSFIPWLEQAGMMKEMDLWVFRRVAQDLSHWRSLGVDLPVSVNICPQTLLDRDSLDIIAALIKPLRGLVHIEITEESLLVDEQYIMSAFKRLRELGVEIHIDDFGTGYSSLSYLNRFDIDCIKIDRSFVLALDNPKGRKVFASLQSLAESLDLSVIVEGVETEQQLSCIETRSEVSVQGWYYAKALHSDDLLEYVRQAQNKPN